MVPIDLFDELAELAFVLAKLEDALVVKPANPIIV